MAEFKAILLQAVVALAVLVSCNGDRHLSGEDEPTDEEICAAWCERLVECGVLPPDDDACASSCMASYLYASCTPGQMEFLACMAEADCDATETPADEGVCGPEFSMSCGFMPMGN